MAHARENTERPVVLALARGRCTRCRGGLRRDQCASRFNSSAQDLRPFQPELAMGAVADGGTSIIVRNEDVIRLANIDEAIFKAASDGELAEIEGRRQRYLRSRKHLEHRDRD